MAKYLHINPADNVAVALEDLQKGTVATFPDAAAVTLLEDIPRGHKFTLRSLSEGENVIKYGYPIGHVIRDAAAGTLVDHSSIKTNLSGILDYTYEPSLVEIPPAKEKRTFMGFRRSDGQVGVRNQIWVVPTVGCVNGIISELVKRFSEEIAGKMGSVDAVVAYPHNYRYCPSSQRRRGPCGFSRL